MSILKEVIHLQHIVIKSVCPSKNSFYRIVVEHSNYKSVVAETYIPDDILLYDINIDSESNNDRIKLRFSYDDVIEQQNYYRLQLYSTCSKEWDDYVYEFNDWVEFLSNDPSFLKMIFHGKVTHISVKMWFLLMLFLMDKKRL